MKKILKSLLVCMLAVSLTACSYTGIIGVTRPGATEHTGPVDPSDPNAFTVTLTLDGKPYKPDAEMYAQWTDGYSYHTAKFSEDGVAGVSGLDGDYRVTLSGVPEGCSYDVNGYQASSDNRHVVIDIRSILGSNKRGEGTGLYEPQIIELTKLGIYRVTLWDENTVVYYQFYPQESGKYSVESLADVTQDQINPAAEIYNGTAAYKNYAYKMDDGGAESASGYTKNFKYECQVSKDMIGNVFAFGVSATSKDGKWPVVVDIAIKLNGGYDPTGQTSSMVVPVEEFQQAPNWSGAFVGAEIPVEGSSDRYLFDAGRYKMWPKDEGGDGYYHLYDEVKYAQYGGYGPTLYAKISQPHRFAELPFTHIEDPGNSALTVDNGASNYKHFIQGWDDLISLKDWGAGLRFCYYCCAECPCFPKDATVGHACPPGCQTCHENCRPCPPELMGKPGYADFCNADGCYPVTQELKDFLQKFSISQLYFQDGNGWVENNPVINVYAYEDSQWLFACGYYVDDPGGRCHG